MEVHDVGRKTFWGNWWEPIRKWFYPFWLLYELTFRFCQYALASYQYIEEISNQILAAFVALITFVVCTAFLTVSSCFIVYHFFQIENLTNTSFEERMKWYF